MELRLALFGFEGSSYTLTFDPEHEPEKNALFSADWFCRMTVILKSSPTDEPVYQFMDKKCAEGKPYKVYMMASANKFLRIYYASVKAFLDSLEEG